MAKSSISFESLQKWNIWAAVLYLAQAVAIVIFGSKHELPINAAYLTKDSIQSQLQGHTVLAPALRHMFDVNLVYVVAAALLVGAIARGLMAWWYRPRYEAELKDGVNKLRWIEYAISSSLMLITIGLLVGVSDLGSLLLLVGLIVTTNLCGLAMEIYNPWRRAMRVKWFSYAVGNVAALIAWVVIAGYMVAANVYGNGLPGFVYFLVPITFLAFVSLSVNTALQYRQKGRWADYYFSERAYLVWGVATGALVAWQVFAGALK